jgi:flagellar biosynthetic protein FliO
MVFSLIAVVAIILGLAWMTRRMQGLRAGGTSELRLRSTLAVGMKERVVIVEAAGQQFLIGVAAGSVTLLQVLAQQEPSSSGRAMNDAGSDAQPAPLAQDPHAAAAGQQEKKRGNPTFGESFAIQLDKLLGR